MRGLGLALTVLALTPVAAWAGEPPPTGDLREAGSVRVYTEVRLPAGTPRGVVLTLHGSGWTGVGVAQARGVASYRDVLAQFRAAGLITVNATYNAREPGWTDVVALHDQIHARWPDLPVEAFGMSAGAHYALLLGVVRPLAGVVSDAGPTDFAAWRDAYTCFYKSCAEVYPGYTSMGRYWTDFVLASVFGDPDRFSPLQYLLPGTTPDVFGIYGRRSGDHPYIVDDDTATSSEVDALVTEAQGKLLQERLGLHATVVYLDSGPAVWTHGNVDAAEATAAYAAATTFLRDHADAATATAPPEDLRPVPRPDAPVGSYVVQTCNAAPPGAAIAATGSWAQAVSPGLDLSENGCATSVHSTGGVAPPLDGPAVGLSLHVRPGFGDVPHGDGAVATFTAPAGTTISGYRAAYRGFRATGDWQLRLVGLDGNGGAATVLSGDPRADTPTDVDLGGRRLGALAWQLSCLAASCSTADTTHAAQLGMTAYLNVFSSAVTISDPDAPLLRYDGATLSASDASGVAALHADLDGSPLLDRALPCDYSRPRPCGDPAAQPLGVDRSRLAVGAHVLTVTATDAAGNVATLTRDYSVAAPPRAVAPAIDPFAVAGAPLLELLCAGGAQLRIADAHVSGRRVRVSGAAVPLLAGRRVTLVQTDRWRTVAYGTVGRDGAVRLIAPKPRRVSKARYRLQVGATRSASFALTRALALTSASRTALTGVAATTKRPVVTVSRVTSCGREQVVGRVRAARDGRFTLRLPRFSGARAVLLTAHAAVRGRVARAVARATAVG